MKLPKMVKVHQSFQTNSIQNIPETIQAEFNALSISNLISSGQTVAITGGSRGIHKIDLITVEIIKYLKQIGAQPFIIPAMGSHGGATVEGQLKVLAHYGITAETMDVPIKASMEVKHIGHTEMGIPVFIDKIASQADHIVVVNRIKAHTDFEAPIESGLMKMLAIGLGKQEAADKYHLDFIKHGHYPILTSVARQIIEKCNISFGVGIVENQKDETENIKIIPANEIEKTEEQLLNKAKKLFPRIPFSPIDLLIVDEISKTYSGTGMDQNVIARSCVPYHNVPDFPKIERIFVRDMALASGGNVTGIGNADFTTQRLVDKIDRDVSYMNAVTAAAPEVVRIPAYFDSDQQVLALSFKTIPDVQPDKARIVRIKNTLELEEMLVSEVMISEVEALENVQIVGIPKSTEFDKKGNLLD
jgi:hypothetical protein